MKLKEMLNNYQSNACLVLTIILLLTFNCLNLSSIQAQDNAESSVVTSPSISAPNQDPTQVLEQNQATNSSVEISPALEVKLLQLDSTQRAFETSPSSNNRQKMLQNYSAFITEWCENNAPASSDDITTLNKRCLVAEQQLLDLSKSDFAKLCQKINRSSELCISAMKSQKLSSNTKQSSPLEEVEKLLQQQASNPNLNRNTNSNQQTQNNYQRQHPTTDSSKLDPEREQTFQALRSLTKALGEYRISPIPKKKDEVLLSYSNILKLVCRQGSNLSKECKFYVSELQRFDADSKLGQCLSQNKSYEDCRAFASNSTKQPSPKNRSNDNSGFTTF
jgi:hypothetical protein